MICQCGFDNTEDLEPVFTDYTGTDVTINLVFHIVRRTDKTGGASSADLAFYMTELENVFGPSGIFFDTMCTQFIDSTPIYDDCDLAFGKNINKWPLTQSTYETSNAINVFIHPTSNNCSDAGNGNMGGYSCWIGNRANRNIVSHEIGHVLNLFHTFANENGRSCFNDSLSLIYSGDLCSDTPPDPETLNSYFTDPSCQWDTAACIGSGASCNDGCMTPTYPHKGFNPKIMMSYYHNCTAIFTTDQQNRMKDKILNHINDSHFDLPVEDLIIHDSLVLMTPYQAAANIIIENGGVLVISSTLYMPEKAKIIIEDGGILSVNGGTITKGKFKDLCHERTGDPRFWYGIEMQFSTGGTPPKFVCINGTIEYSEKGVHNPTSKNAGNGTIKIYNSSFKNNKASIFIERAPSFSSPISVNKTRFYLDSSFSLSNYYTQIHIDNSKIYLDSCTFDNPGYLQPLTDSAYAIRTMNTNIGIQHSTFKDNIYGLQSMNFLSNATIGVSNCRFMSTKIGINTLNVDKYSITKDTFDSSFKFGLISDRCSGYIINNNHFRRGIGTPTDSAGIQMNNSGTGENVIEKNVYTSVKHGNVTNGINGDVKGNLGLKFYCNDFYSIANHDNVFNGQVNGIQGLSDIGAGNTASDNQIDHLINLTPRNDIIIYYFKDSISSHIPDSDPKFQMTKIPVHLYTCNLHKKPDTVTHIVTYQKYVDTLDLRKTKHTDSIDGGNSTSLLAYIAAANSGTATLLYNHLINKSPWLSEAVVLAAYNRSDIFDSTKRAQIIFKNPDAMRSGDLRSSLRNADTPLPTSSLDALDTSTLYTTSRTALEAEITEFALFKSMICYEIINQLKLDTIDQSDSILVWLDRVKDYSSAREIMETHFENGEFTEAISALSDLDEMENLGDDEISDIEGLSDLLPYIAVVREYERYEGNLSSEEIEWMVDYAENNANKSGSEVRCALSFYYDINAADMETLSLSTYNKVNPKGELVKTLSTKYTSEDFSIYPNPLNNELIINVPKGVKADKWNVKILDLDGRVLSEYNSGNTSFKVGIMEIPTGIFIVRLSGSQGKVYTKRILVIK